MRKYFVIVVLLCVCITAAAQDAAQVVNGSENEALAKAFDEAFSEAEKDQKSLDTETVRHPGSLQSIEFGFVESEVKKSFESIRKKLLKALDDNEYEGLKNQIGASFPDPDLEFLGMKDFRVIVTEKSVENGYKRINEYMTELKTETAKSRVNLKIIVNGGQEGFATFKLGFQRTITATGVIPNIIRKSRLRYVVSKPGFHEINGVLDLQNATPVSLTCNLQEDTAQNNQVGCTENF